MRSFVTAMVREAALRSNVAVGEMFRAMIRTVLVVQAVASNSVKRVN